MLCRAKADATTSSGDRSAAVRHCVTIEGLTGSSRYNIRVAAVNAAGRGEFVLTKIACKPVASAFL